MSAVQQLNLISKVLQPFGPRFIRVEKHSKDAIDKGCLENLLTREQIEPWFNEGGNYGVVAGEGIIIVDLDDLSLCGNLPETFSVQTGGIGLHTYFRSDVTENGVIEKNKQNLGHVQAKHKYVVGPGSKHPNGNTYKILEEKPLAWISKQQLENVFGELLKWTGIERFIPQAQEEFKKSQIDITKVVPMQGLAKRGNEYQGLHPVHGSERTGMNFCVNPSKNVWHCFRCESGGGHCHG